jgi:hypothetical protein
VRICRHKARTIRERCAIISKNWPAALVVHVGAANLSVVYDGRRRLYISSRSSRGRFKNEHERCHKITDRLDFEVVGASHLPKKVANEVRIEWKYL